jgi:NAD(P)-dependent dehydrogenase (short-subunit alcohol dehydrogenase family)
MGKLSHNVADVTGASKGIGAEIARELAAESASVVVNYAASRDLADKVVDEIAAPAAGRLRSRVTSRRPRMLSAYSPEPQASSDRSIFW